MIFIYSDEDARLNDSIKSYVEKAAQLALASELDIASDIEARLSDVEYCESCLAAEFPVELSITVVDAEEIRSINAEFRGIDKTTDVLSFPQHESIEDLAYEIEDALEEGTVFNPMLGDVVLCYDRACEQAEEYGTGVERELVYLTVHSIFHLLGYDHMEEDEKAEMRAREEAVMTAIGLARQ
ncbi:MAG: rRNA maturation RNase YbeY [Firmicutes bacterium]|nr:rRNA maturation RNase YbeY [Bacillota bacterium]